MKKILLFVPLLLLLLSSTQKKGLTTVTISTDPAVDLVELTSAIDGFILWDQKKDTLYRNKEGVFKWSTSIQQPEILRLKVGKKRFKLLLQKNKAYHLELVNGDPQFLGDNAAGLQLYHELKRPFYTMTEASKYAKDSTANIILQKINTLKTAEKASFKQLLNNRQITASFYELVVQDIDYYYAHKMAEIILSKQVGNKPLPTSLENLLASLKEDYPIKVKGFYPRYWGEYVATMTIYGALYDSLKNNAITQQNLQDFYETDHTHPYYAQLIGEQLQGEIKEKTLARYLLSAAAQNHFEKSLIYLFKDYQQEFRNSPYTPYVKAKIDQIIAYHEKIAAPLTDAFTLIEGEGVNSFDDLLEKMKGQKFYVDLWATWCGPCKREFKHNTAIDPALLDSGYKKLYISIDKQEDKDKWLDNIKYYELKGTHLLASKAFVEDFMFSHSVQKGMMMIPQYLLVDEEGKIITNNAPKPSEEEQLLEMIRR